MTLYILRNGFHPDENNISLGWQKESISGAGLELSIRPQCMTDLDLWYRSVYYLDL